MPPVTIFIAIWGSVKDNVTSMQNDITNITESFVKTRLSGEGTGHDWWHAVRVHNTAGALQAKEGGDATIITLAALLHDVGDRKVLGTDEDDYSIAADFLEQQGVDQQVVDHVIHIISTMSFSKSLDSSGASSESIEFQIVQDADRLDALGAIGIARAFAYGGSRGRPLYDPDYTAQDFASRDAYVNNKEGSTLHHFDEKLFKLKNLLNTGTAKDIAKNRDTYMREFQQRFMAEWDGIL